MSESDGILRVYADYVCPFCYLGRRSLDRYREPREDDLAIEWHPFDLRSHKRGPDGEIDHSVEDGKDDAYFERAYENVRRLREEYEVEMLDPEDVADADSLDAQIASSYVQEEHPEYWLAFDEGVYEAHWAEGRNIDDVDVLAEIAEDVGVDGEEIREAVRDEERRERVFEAFEEAQRHGVTGVPTFVYDGYAARGAVPPQQLQRLVEGPGETSTTH